jgi:hypothetical protein
MDLLRVAALLFVMALVSGCTDRAQSPDEHRRTTVEAGTHEVAKTASEPKFWTDDIAAEMIRTQLDLAQATTTVCVARWENGTIEGWAELGPQEKSERILLKTMAAAPDDGTKAIWITVPPKSPKSSGWLVIVLKRDATDPENVYQCRIHGQYTCRENTSSPTYEFVEITS